jgi:hypothetical protein
MWNCSVARFPSCWVQTHCLSKFSFPSTAAQAFSLERSKTHSASSHAQKIRRLDAICSIYSYRRWSSSPGNGASSLSLTRWVVASVVGMLHICDRYPRLYRAWRSGYIVLLGEGEGVLGTGWCIFLSSSLPLTVINSCLTHPPPSSPPHWS